MSDNKTIKRVDDIFSFRLVFEDLSENEKSIVLDRIEYIKECLYQQTSIIPEEQKEDGNSYWLVFEDLLDHDVDFIRKLIENEKSVLWIEYGVILKIVNFFHSNIPVINI